MNSKPNVFHNDRLKKAKERCPTILKCSCPRGLISVPATTPTPPLVLTTVAVNIPDCCNPCVKIEYTSTIGFVAGAGGAVVSITITIFKNCTNNIRVPIGSRRYIIDGIPGLFTSTSTFSFFVCDCDTCPSDDCCYYSAEITASSVAGTVVTIEDPILAALVTSSDCNC